MRVLLPHQLREPGHEDVLDLGLHGLEGDAGDELGAARLLGLEDERIEVALFLRETAVRGNRPADVRGVAADPGPDVEDDDVAGRERTGGRPEVDVGRVRAGAFLLIPLLICGIGIPASDRY
jgi:hypothetical protein